MPQQATDDVDALAVPTEDGQVLIWPQRPSLAAMAESNRRLRTGYTFKVLDQPATGLMGDGGSDQPIIMAGHQPSFIHPGVWSKIRAASRVARETDGTACFLVVDSDVAGRLMLSWPVLEAGHLRASGAPPFAGSGGLSYEQLPPQAMDYWQAFFAKVPEEWRGGTRSALGAFAGGFLDPQRFAEKPERPGAAAVRGDAHDRSNTDYVTRWVAGLSAVDEALGVRSPRFVRESNLFFAAADLASTRLLHAVAHLLVNAERFAGIYNAALESYRVRRGVRGHHRPMPDLLVETDRIEAPFWMLRKGRGRERLFISRPTPDSLRLMVTTQPVATFGLEELARDPGEMLGPALVDWRLRPRALALTMLLRLFSCDLFIHGVGGAKYDQITDQVIRLFFGVEPPSYACVTATVHLPLPVHRVMPADRLNSWRLVRDLTYNPQRCIAGSRGGRAELIADRERAIAESVRLGREEPDRHAARRIVYQTIRRLNAAILAGEPEKLGQAERRFAEVEEGLAHNRIAMSREWFFALYPMERLAALCQAMI
jgi:hypothetical protein